MENENENQTTTFSMFLTEEEQLPRPSTDSSSFFKYIRICVAEMWATATFVFVGVCCSRNLYYPALPLAFILFVNVAVTANVSGGHLNPAVTLAMTIVRAIPVTLAPFYVMAQLIGAIIGAGLAKAVMSSDDYDYVTEVVHQHNHEVNAGVGILAGAVATSIWVLAVLMVAFDENNKSVLAPLAIGLAVGAGIYAIDISGGSMNPARSFGLAVVHNFWDNQNVNWAGPILGSLFSTIMYGLFLASPNRLWLPVYARVN